MKKREGLKSKNIILFFAWLSLVFELIVVSGHLIHFSNIDKIIFMPDVINIASKVLLIIYMTKWSLREKKHLIFFVAVGMIVLDEFMFAVVMSISYYYVFLVDILKPAVIITMLIFVKVNVLHGKKKNVFIIVATAFEFLLYAYDYYPYIFRNIKEGDYFIFIFNISGMLSNPSIYISLMIFLLRNRIPAIIQVNLDENKSQEATYSPAQSLRDLRDKYDMRLITEEEYKKARADIISKL